MTIKALTAFAGAAALAGGIAGACPDKQHTKLTKVEKKSQCAGEAVAKLTSKSSCASTCPSQGTALTRIPAAPAEPGIAAIPAAPMPAAFGDDDRLVWFGDDGRRHQLDEHSVMHFVSRDNDRTIEIHIDNGDIEAQVDGHRVDGSRIKMTDNAIKILGEHGELITMVPFHVDDHTMGFNVGAHNVFGLGNNQNAFFAAQDEEAPRVMVGINFGTDEGFVWDLVPYDADEAFVISKVIEGLPAKRAGLKDNDLVVAIDGRRPATPDLLRERLFDKEPGDKLKLRVYRKGDEKDIAVKLVPYDGVALGSGPASAPRLEIQAEREAQQALEEAMRALELAQGERGQRARELATAREHLEKMMRENQERGRTLRIAPGQGNAFVWRDQNDRADELGDRLDGLEDRLDGIEDKLDDILDALGR